VKERERGERKAPVSIKRSLRPSPFSRRLSAARLASKCIRLAFRLVEEAEEGAEGEDLEVCERVSPRARACTPLMAPSGYSRGTLSYLLFNAGRRRKREEKEKNRPRVRAGERKGAGRQGGEGTRIYPQTSHASRTPEFRRIRFREWKARGINADTGSLRGGEGRNPGMAPSRPSRRS